MVVDTGIFIEHLRAKDKTRTTLSSIAAVRQKYVSIATVYELHYGATTAEKVKELDQLLEDFAELAIDRSVALKAADVFTDLRRRNQLIGSLDILIAATALVNTQPVKTLNINHFKRVDGIQFA